MLRALSLLAALGLLATLFVIFTQSSELQATKNELHKLTSEFQKIKDENKQFRVANAILEGATTGLHSTKPETIKEVKRVIGYILGSKGITEDKFKECWDRKLKTTQWGSMGPYGLLDECIDSIVDAKSAIFIREIDSSVETARYTCQSEGRDRYERAKNCWADRNFRLLTSANDALFASITTPNWIESQNSAINE